MPALQDRYVQKNDASEIGKINTALDIYDVEEVLTLMVGLDNTIMGSLRRRIPSCVH